MVFHFIGDIPGSAKINYIMMSVKSPFVIYAPVEMFISSCCAGFGRRISKCKAHKATLTYDIRMCHAIHDSSTTMCVLLPHLEVGAVIIS